MNMEFIRLQENNQEEVVERVVRALQGGKIVAVPTDTVYGFIADATNQEAIERMYALKDRTPEKAFPVFVRDIAMARWFAYVSDAKAKFLENVWPGPVTAIFHHKEKLPNMLTAGRDTIGMRVPNSSFLSALLDRINIPLAQGSANISGILPAMTAEGIITSFEARKQKPDVVIDGGKLSGMPSTIIDFTSQQPRIIRSGLVNKEELESLINRLMLEN